MANLRVGVAFKVFIERGALEVGVWSRPFVVDRVTPTAVYFQLPGHDTTPATRMMSRAEWTRLRVKSKVIVRHTLSEFGDA